MVSEDKTSGSPLRALRCPDGAYSSAISALLGLSIMLKPYAVRLRLPRSA